MTTQPDQALMERARLLVKEKLSECETFNENEETIVCWLAEFAARERAWRPMGSAPKDGTTIIAYNGEVCLMKWIKGDEYALWVHDNELLSDVEPEPEQPLVWQPLPEPPTRKDEV